MSRAKIESNGLTFTWNQKCDCYQFNLPPRQSCPGVEERLKNPKSICNYCYAKFGRFGQMEASQVILQKNLKKVLATREALLILDFMFPMGKFLQGQKYFRWFGCGDIVNRKLNNVIINLAYVFPKVKFWCPTQTTGSTAFWENLVIRQSATYLGDPAPPGGHCTLLPGAKKMKGHFVCPGKCDPCRRCWEPWKPETRIAFPFHGNAVLMGKLNKARRIHKF